MIVVGGTSLDGTITIDRPRSVSEKLAFGTGALLDLDGVVYAVTDFRDEGDSRILIVERWQP